MEAATVMEFCNARVKLDRHRTVFDADLTANLPSLQRHYGANKQIKAPAVEICR
jgi:hypothetical protein